MWIWNKIKQLAISSRTGVVTLRYPLNPGQLQPVSVASRSGIIPSALAAPAVPATVRPEPSFSAIFVRKSGFSSMIPPAALTVAGVPTSVRKSH